MLVVYACGGIRYGCCIHVLHTSDIHTPLHLVSFVHKTENQPSPPFTFHRFVDTCESHGPPLNPTSVSLWVSILHHALVSDSTTDLVQHALLALLRVCRGHGDVVAH